VTKITTPNEEQLSTLAKAATKAIALELLKIVPIIGPYISVGTRTILEKLEKMELSGDNLTATSVLDWMTKLSPDAYEKLVLNVIDLEPLIKNNAQKDEIITIFLRSKPDIGYFVQLLSAQEGSARQSRDEHVILDRVLSAEKRQPTIDERNIILGHDIHTNDWIGAMRQIDHLMVEGGGNEMLHKLDLLVARRISWTKWAIAASLSILALVVYTGVLYIQVLDKMSHVMGIDEVKNKIQDTLLIAFTMSFLTFVLMSFLFPNVSWTVRRLLKRSIVTVGICAVLVVLITSWK